MQRAEKRAIIGAMTKSGLSALAGIDVFLRKGLDAVRNRLQQTERPYPVRAEPDLEAAEHLSFRKGQVGDEAHEHRDHQKVLDDGLYEKEEYIHHLTLSAPLPRPILPGRRSTGRLFAVPEYDIFEHARA